MEGRAAEDYSFALSWILFWTASRMQLKIRNRTQGLILLYLHNLSLGDDNKFGEAAAMYIAGICEVAAVPNLTKMQGRAFGNLRGTLGPSNPDVFHGFSTVLPC